MCTNTMDAQKVGTIQMRTLCEQISLKKYPFIYCLL